MKIFIDTAKIEEIKEAASWGVLDGVTTNPFAVLESLFKHPLTESGIKRFLDDWSKIPKA